jgi:hypothetical protein
MTEKSQEQGARMKEEGARSTFAQKLPPSPGYGGTKWRTRGAGPEASRQRCPTGLDESRRGTVGREKFSRDVWHFGRKMLIGSGLIMRLCKSRGFRGLQFFFTGFSRFFIGFSRDFHAEVSWFSRVRQNGGVFLFFWSGKLRGFHGFVGFGARHNPC